MPSSSSERRLLFGAFALGAWLAATMPVFSQEAYYWLYARHPALSYHDHPPVVAWSIRAATVLFGDGLVSLRICTWLYACATTCIGLALLRDFGARPEARRAWILASVAVPGYLASHFYATPDAPLVFFGALALLALYRARGGRLVWWSVCGLAAGLALASKYSAAYLALGGAAVLVLDPKLRAQIRRPGPWLALGLALLAFSPVVVWNVRHRLESFTFQTAGRFEDARLGTRWAVTALLGQLATLHPLVFAFMPAVIAWLVRQWRRGELRAAWLLAFGVPLPLFFALTSLWIKTKFNWFLPGYFALLIGACWWWSESGVTERRPRFARVVRRTMVGTALLALIAPAMRLVPQRSETTWYGWDRIAERASCWRREVEARPDARRPLFFAAADHKDAAQLWRALSLAGGAAPDAALPPVLSENLFGEPALEFDHWTAPRDQVGRDAIFVLARPERRKHHPERLRAVFFSTALLEHVEVECLGRTVLSADIWWCRGYRGPATESESGS